MLFSLRLDAAIVVIVVGVFVTVVFVADGVASAVADIVAADPVVVAVSSCYRDCHRESSYWGPSRR